MRRFALILFATLAVGSLPVLSARAGGSGQEMLRSHFPNQESVALDAGDPGPAEAALHHLRPQDVVAVKRNSGTKTVGLHHASQLGVVNAKGDSGFGEADSYYAMQQNKNLSTGIAALKQKLRTLATKKVRAECASCKVTVECKWIAPLVLKASPEIISGLYFDKPGMPSGYAVAKVAYDSAPPSANATVQFYVSVQQKVPVAAANIKSGAPVSAADFIWQWKNVSRLNRQPVTSKDYLKNKAAARMIRKGRIFYPSDLLEAMSFQPGDRVRMQYGGEGVQLQVACIVREAKGVGQKVRLYSRETGRRYLAKIISENEIIWVKTL